MTSTSIPSQAPAPTGTAWSRYEHLAACLTANKAHDTPELHKVLELLVRGDWVPFEVISGTPSDSYGTRITVSSGSMNPALAAKLGLTSHPWGSPDWIGIRTSDRGVETKPYHRAGRYPQLPTAALPLVLAASAVPVMASLRDNMREDYWRILGDLTWQTVAETALAPLGVAPQTARPQPRPVAGAFCVSYQYDTDRLDAVTLYASDRALPPDVDLPELWIEGLSPTDTLAYDSALDYVRSLGPRPHRGFHAMLAWKYTRSGLVGRAVSLRVPQPKRPRANQ